MVEYFGVNKEQVNKDEWDFWAGKKNGFFGSMLTMDQLRAEEFSEAQEIPGSLGYVNIFWVQQKLGKNCRLI